MSIVSDTQTVTFNAMVSEDEDRLGLEDGRVSVSVSRPDMNALSGQAMSDCFLLASFLF